jgi:hypothetical protein
MIRSGKKDKRLLFFCKKKLGVFVFPCEGNSKSSKEQGLQKGIWMINF